MLLLVLVDCWIIGDTEYQFSRIFWSWYIGVYYFRQLYSVITLLIVHVHNSLVFFTLWIIGNIILPLIEQIITMSMIRISNYQKDILRLPFEKIINRINSLDTSRTTIEIYEVREKKRNSRNAKYQLFIDPICFHISPLSVYIAHNVCKHTLLFYSDKDIKI